MDIKLIATDIDGTLLDDDCKISSENRSAIQAAMDLGIAFTLSTGRMFASTKAFAAELGVREPVICYNGAMTRHPDGTILSHTPLDMDTAKNMLTLFKQRGLYVQSYLNDTLYVNNISDEEFKYYMKTYGIMGHPIGESLYSPDEPPTKLLVMTSTASEASLLMKELQGLFGSDAYVTTSNYNFVEMMNPGVNKGKSLRALADSMGISMDNVLAIGDGDNDVEMVAAAGVGIAMGNGCKRLKESAKHIAPTNRESGLAWAIKEFALPK